MTALLLPKWEAGEKRARVIVQILRRLGNQMFQYALGDLATRMVQVFAAQRR